MRKLVAVLSIPLLLIGANCVSASSRTAQLVLVTAADSPIDPLSAGQIRSVFLGLPIENRGVQLRPLQNVSDPLLYEVFLQKTVFMSARSYERQLILRVFRSGGQRPLRFEDERGLVATLRHNPGAITYMWEHSARQTAGIRILQGLWEGALE